MVHGVKRLLYSPWIYPLWGPAALWLNVLLYGHRLPIDPGYRAGWLARCYLRAPWAKREMARRIDRMRRLRDQKGR